MGRAVKLSDSGVMPSLSTGVVESIASGVRRATLRARAGNRCVASSTFASAT
jgi:hypothetical protein